MLETEKSTRPSELKVNLTPKEIIEKLKGILAYIISEVINSDPELTIKETKEQIEKELVFDNSEHPNNKINHHKNSSDLVAHIKNKKILIEK